MKGENWLLAFGIFVFVFCIGTLISEINDLIGRSIACISIIGMMITICIFFYKNKETLWGAGKTL